MTAPLRFGPYRLDAADAALWLGTERVRLAPKCFDLLCLLAGRAGEIVAKQELIAAIWPDTHVGDGTLKVLMRELRTALGDDAAQPRYIETVQRRGYRFVAATESAAPARGAPGRDPELAALATHLTRAEAGERQVVFVAGEAGIGKTLLVETFLAGLPATCAVAVGQCLDHFGGGEAYLPLLDALTRLGRGPSGDAVRQVLGDRAPSWMGSLPGWQPSPPRGDTRERMLREMAEGLEALSEGATLVLVLEDLHWSDPSTIDLLSLLAHRRAPARLLVIGTYRPVDAIIAEHRLRGVIHRLSQQRLGVELHLGPLPEAAVAAYLQQRLNGAALPAALVDALCERTAGQPLFLVSLVDHLLQRRWLEVEAGGATLTVPAERIASELPDDVRELIEQQLALLPAEAREVLAAASLAGDEFAAAAVAAGLAADHQQIEAVCEGEVRRGQFLRPLGSRELPDGTLSERYAFVHTLQRDVLGRTLASAQRVTVHQRLGAWLEATGAPAAEVARHFHDGAGGADTAKAVHHSRRAAERARELLAFAEAAAHYERAVAALVQAGDADAAVHADLLIALGEVRERNGQLARAAEAFTAAADLARRAGASDQLARAALGLGRGHQLVGRAEPALTALLEEALAALPDHDSGERAGLLARLDAALSPIAGNHERRAALRREAAAMARRVGDVETRLRVLQYARWGFNGDGDPDQLRAAAAELAGLVERAAGSEQALHLQLLQLGHLAELGDMDAARDLLERFGRRADDAGIPWFRWFTLRLRAMHALQDGRFADTAELARAAAAFGERMDHPNVRPLLAAQLLALDLLQGRAAEVATRLERYLAQSPAQPLLRAQLAHARCAAGDLHAARRELALLAADDFAAIPRDSVWLAALAHLAEVCAAVGDRRHAATIDALLAPYADRIIGAGSGVASLGHGARYRALLAATLGRDADARRLCAIARTAHERMSARPWLAYTLRDEARMRERMGEDGSAARQRAHQLANQLGMVGLAREVAQE